MGTWGWWEIGVRVVVVDVFLLRSHSLSLSRFLSLFLVSISQVFSFSLPEGGFYSRSRGSLPSIGLSLVQQRRRKKKIVFKKSDVRGEVSVGGGGGGGEGKKLSFSQFVFALSLCKVCVWGEPSISLSVSSLSPARVRFHQNPEEEEKKPSFSPPEAEPGAFRERGGKRVFFFDRRIP